MQTDAHVGCAQKSHVVLGLEPRSLDNTAPQRDVAQQLQVPRFVGALAGDDHQQRREFFGLRRRCLIVPLHRLEEHLRMLR